jgi:hypothetical protein
MVEPRDEYRQLEEYHQALAARDTTEQVNLLLNGFLPDATEALVEAGIRCIPLIESSGSELSESAIHRLEAILFKLKNRKEDTAIRNAADRFEKLIAHRRKGQRSDTRLGFALIAGLSVLAGGLIVLAIWLLTR